MQGVYVNYRRPTTKRALREALAADPSRVSLEATSFFGGEYDGPVSEAPDGRYAIVGPDPHVSRVFYATIEVRDGQVTCT